MLPFGHDHLRDSTHNHDTKLCMDIGLAWVFFRSRYKAMNEHWPFSGPDTKLVT